MRGGGSETQVLYKWKKPKKKKEKKWNAVVSVLIRTRSEMHVKSKILLSKNVLCISNCFTVLQPHRTVALLASTEPYLIKSLDVLVFFVLFFFTVLELIIHRGTILMCVYLCYFLGMDHYVGADLVIPYFNTVCNLLQRCLFFPL